MRSFATYFNALEQSTNLLQLRIVYEDFYEDRWNLTKEEWEALNGHYNQRRNGMAQILIHKLQTTKNK